MIKRPPSGDYTNLRLQIATSANAAARSTRARGLPPSLEALEVLLKIPLNAKSIIRQPPSTSAADIGALCS
jgi:hypothetical protein